ncbi:conserved hypothetical protein [Pseudomonas sp. 8AS]|uniref:hypothetical protein n=1 Tax=Pseudomonas sp. 8AS TaxID=2653163 RepID=UPI0012F0432B|nr:hypothetical protein [Pseudomonas sp. 8AS]VXB04674.1 conserved hypothetical protein [Pseudomonas sp. 8AS]
MNSLALLILALMLLAVLGWAFWSWRSAAQLQQLAQRAQQQRELIDAMNEVLDNPVLSEDERLAHSLRLAEKLKATRR